MKSKLINLGLFKTKNTKVAVKQNLTKRQKTYRVQFLQDDIKTENSNHKRGCSKYQKVMLFKIRFILN